MTTTLEVLLGLSSVVFGILLFLYAVGLLLDVKRWDEVDYAFIATILCGVCSSYVLSGYLVMDGALELTSEDHVRVMGAILAGLRFFLVFVCLAGIVRLARRYMKS